MWYPSLGFRRHRALYHELLNEVRLGGDWECWPDFFAEGIEASAAQAVATAASLVNTTGLTAATVNKSVAAERESP